MPPIRRLAVFLVLGLMGLAPRASQAAAVVHPSAAAATSRELRPPRTTEERALLAIQDDAVRRVHAVVLRMKGLGEGAARQALEREAGRIKQQCELDMLRARLSFARARGELAAARELQDRIAALEHPVAPVPGRAEPKPAGTEVPR